MINKQESDIHMLAKSPEPHANHSKLDDIR